MNQVRLDDQDAVRRWTKEVRNVEVEPAQRLMLAVLQEAVLTLIVSPPQRSMQARRQVQEAARWVRSSSRAHPFTFLSICEALGLDDDYLRRAISEWRRSERKE
jgi:hypothetical protein